MRWGVIAAAAVVVSAVVWLAVTPTAGQAKPVNATPSAATAKVTDGKLSETVSESGTLTYRAHAGGSPYEVFNQSAGTYTNVPDAGQVISQGKVLYRVNDTPVVLLYGSIPAFRTLSEGSAGADVAELNADLVKLGYVAAAELGNSSAAFGSGTAAAVAKLQSAVGLTPDGVLTLGEGVFEPDAVRVTSLSVALGAPAQVGQTVLAGTSTTREVDVALDASEQTTVAAGDTVSITLPDNRTISGVVSAVGAVATCPASSGQGGGSTSSPTAGTTCSSSGSGGGDPTVNVSITPAKPSETGTWDQAPVQVGITTSTVANALAVPVTALLAESGGGYTVEVVTPTGHRLVPVSLGLFDDAAGLVQVTGRGIAAGQEVVVPAT